MAELSEIIQDIHDNIHTNGQNQITGQLLQTTLDGMAVGLSEQVSQLGQETSGIVIDNGTTYNEKYGSTNRTCVFYPIPDKNAIYHIRISEINNQTEAFIYLGVLNAQSPYSSAQLFYFGDIQKLSSNDVVLMFQIPENVKSSAEYIGVFQSLSNSSLCSFKVELSYCNKDSVCDHTFRMWHKITSLKLNTKVGNVRGDDGVVSTSKFCIFTDLFLLKKGDTIVVGNAHNNIGCIYTNNQQSIAQGDTVTVLVSSGGTDDYQELSYTAQSDIMVGVSFSVNNKFTVYSSLDDTYKLAEIEPIKETIVEEGSSWNS